MRFHCQQCAEKYLKAFLQENDQHIPKINNLKELLELCLEFDSNFEMLHADLVLIDRYSVHVRYPGTLAVKDEAKEAYKAASIAREFLRQKLGLSKEKEIVIKRKSNEIYPYDALHSDNQPCCLRQFVHARPQPNPDRSPATDGRDRVGRFIFGG